MLFNSIAFAAFFPAVVIVHYLLAPRLRWAFLLAASYFFYACWEPAYTLLIVVSTLVDYYAARRMAAAEHSRRRRWLWLSLAVNLGLLGTFKYYRFVTESLEGLIGWTRVDSPFPIAEWLLPVGISFYTFQTLSYTIDVYRGDREPEHHLGIFALYVSFFPQLVAGPIERSTRLLPQLDKLDSGFDAARASSGLQLMLWGLFQKLVIADNVAPIVEMAYSRDFLGVPATAPGPLLVVGTVLFAFQILCDFAGYSLIAIGAARVLGVDLMRNFDRPYFAWSVQDFWRRWHISLSTWFRDYVYIPLGGSRTRRRSRLYRNVMIVFVVSGLWHGANWTFVIWGALHGLFLCVSLLTRKTGAELREPRGVVRVVRQLTTFALVCFAWIFFRAQSLDHALAIVGGLTSGWEHTGIVLQVLTTRLELWVACVGIVLLLLVDGARGSREVDELVTDWPRAARWACYYFLCVWIWIAAPFAEAPFLYFQF